MCRSGRIGGASGSVSLGNGRCSRSSAPVGRRHTCKWYQRFESALLFALGETVHSDIDQLARLVGSAAADRVKFLARQLVVMGKKRLDLVQQFGTQVVQRCDMRMTAAASCYCEQPIVLDPFAFLLALLCLDDPDQSGGEHATNRGRGIQQDEHVQRISVIAK